MHKHMRIFARRAFADFGIHLHAAEYQDGMPVAIATAVTMHAVAVSALGNQTAPLLTIDDSAAKRLMDELWNCGIRPSEVGSVGALAATERHLADLQRLVFGNGKPRKPFMGVLVTPDGEKSL